MQNFLFILLVSILTTIMAACPPVDAATLTWINPAGGDWNIASNWSPPTVPTLADDAIFNLPGPYTINFPFFTPVYSIYVDEGNMTFTGIEVHIRNKLFVGTKGFNAFLTIDNTCVNFLAFGVDVGPNGVLTVNSIIGSTGNPFFIDSGGIVMGSGGFKGGDLINNGLLSPGPLPGTTSVMTIGVVANSNYTQNATGVLEIEISGTVPGSEYDYLLFESSLEVATLGGTLNVSLLGAFSPSPGDTFVIIKNVSISGTFDTVNLPPGFGIIYGTDKVILYYLVPPTFTPTPTITPTITPTPTTSSTPTITSTPTTSSTPTITPTATISSTPTITPISTNTPTPTASFTPTLMSIPADTGSTIIILFSLICISVFYSSRRSLL